MTPLKLLRHALFVCCAVAAVALAPSAADAQRTLRYLDGSDLPGGDYRTLREVEQSDCERACLADSGCAGFTYNTRVNWCFLKSEIGTPAPYSFALSAIVEGNARTQALPLPQVDNLPPGLTDEATRLEGLAATVANAGDAVDFIDPTIASRLVAGAPGVWRSFAQDLLQRQIQDYGRRQQALRDAAAAAFLAARRATTPQAQAVSLAVLSEALERQQLFRAALNAQAASVALVATPASSERLERLRSQYGFRVLDYSVDSATVTPRLCVQFSEPLQGRASDLERFVAVDEIAAPTVSVNARQLCVEGLEHGKRYTVRVRQGLPAVTGERLTATAEFVSYVRDRPPLARFESNRYVLPAGSAGLPVTSVNSAALEIAVYRIGDRSLADVVRRGDFKRQLYPYQVREIEAETGIEIWSGVLDVEPVRNRDVVTLLPVDETIGSTEPGVYLVTARPMESANASDAVATQWLVVSDIGIATFSNGGTVDVFVRSLEALSPLPDADLSLLSRSNDILATGTTDADGHARLASVHPADGALAPALLTVRHGETDYAFVDLAAGAFELSDRGVAGRAAPGPIDAFLATERGVYRAGETVHLTSLIRNDTAEALTVPVTLKLYRPDGKLSRRIVGQANAAGGLVSAIPLATNAATGSWRIAAHVDPDGPEVGETRFLVEDFVPQRIAVDLEFAAETVEVGTTVEASVQADFLYGVPAADLMLEGSVLLRAADGIDGYEGYQFGLVEEPFTAERETLADLPRTDAAGRATFPIAVPDSVGATQALEARVLVSVREPGGRQVAAARTLPVVTGDPLIGIKPLFSERVQEGSSAGFNLIALDGNRDRIGADSNWTLSKIVVSYQWYRRNGLWAYDRVERIEQVASGTAAIGADAPASVSIPVDWGQYRFDVSAVGNDAVASSVDFTAGWASGGATADTPDGLDVSLDRDAFAVGDTATLTIAPRYAGKALVTVLTDRVADHHLVDVPAEGTRVPLTVRDEYVPGAYVTVTLYRDRDPAEDRPLPTRAVGVAYLAADTDARRLAVSIDAPDEIRPRQTLEVPVTLTGIAPGEEAFVTLAAVDVGILNLTGYAAPDPTEHYLGQRQLSVELRDIYGELIDASAGTLGRIRSGGDAAGAAADALPPNEQPVALFSGLLEADENGTARAELELPAFDGALRLMAIAWTADQVGNAHQDMVVRDPTVVAATMPRFLAPGDRTRVRVDVHNVAGPSGEHTLLLAADGPVDIDLAPRTLNLERDSRASFELPLVAQDVGETTISVVLEAPDGAQYEKSYTLAIRPPAPLSTRRSLVAVAPGDTEVFGAQLLAGFSDEADVTLTVGGTGIDVAGLLAMLDRFPYGCAEQTVSRALPLLYVNDTAERLGLAEDTALSTRIDNAIEQVLAYQSTSGGFGLWGPGSDMWLSAYVMDFLTRAREAGYTVESLSFESGLDRLQSQLSYVGDIQGARGSEIAYALYVLSRNGRAAIGDVRYFVEERLDDFSDPLARAQLASSLVFAGDRALGERIFRSALDVLGEDNAQRLDYGSVLRDTAAVLALAAEADAAARTQARLVRRLTALRSAAVDTAPTTQEASWLILASNAEAEKPIAAQLDGQPLEQMASERLDRTALMRDVSVSNDGNRALLVTASVTGQPLAPLPAVSRGLSLTRTYHTLDGAEVDPSRVAQNTRLWVRLEVAKTSELPMRLMLTDLLPAGFEIENTRLAAAAGTGGGGPPFALTGKAPEHRAMRDDRYNAAWSLTRYDKGTFVTAYLVRAVSPGTFIHPGAQVEDMYTPSHVARTEHGSIAIAPTR